MTFMPGDSTRPVPRFVEAEWTPETPEYRAWATEFNLKPKSEKYSTAGMQEIDLAWKTKRPRYTRRIDLTPIITPELVARVRADRRNTLLKLIITFNNNQVDIKAQAYKWR